MNRIESVDSIRLLAIIAVIAIHTGPFLSNSTEGDNNQLGIIINQLSRFAVPFFFVVSGYFWGVKIRGGSNPLVVTKKIVSRIIVIFLAWSVIYILPYNVTSIHEYGLLGPLKMSYWSLTNVLQNPALIFLQGTKGHLWFLPSLLFALGISLLFVSRKAEKRLFVFALALYLIGMLLKSYASTPLGISVDFNTRNGPFFSTLLFVSGYFISSKKNDEKWLFYGLSLLLFGITLHFSEIYFLKLLYGISMLQDYVLGTYFMGVGAAIVSLSNHKFLRVNFLSKIGEMTLGIYAIHYVFVDLLIPIDLYADTVFWEIGFVSAVLVLSVFVTNLLSKSVTFRRIVL